MTIKYPKSSVLQMSQLPYIQFIYDSKNKIIGGEILARLKIQNQILPAEYIFNHLRNNEFEKYIELQKNFINEIFNLIYPAFINKKLFLFININVDDFYYSENFYFFFKEKLKDLFKSEISLKNLVLEITENKTHNGFFYKVINELNKLRKEFNFKIALDDFGTESSNFEKLLNIKPDIVKIDGMFIKKYTDEMAKDIILHIVKLCKKYNIQIVFECIENDKVLNDLKKMVKEFDIVSCDLFQGFHLDTPDEGVKKIKGF